MCLIISSYNLCAFTFYFYAVLCSKDLSLYTVILLVPWKSTYMLTLHRVGSAILEKQEMGGKKSREEGRANRKGSITQQTNIWQQVQPNAQSQRIILEMPIIPELLRTVWKRRVYLLTPYYFLSPIGVDSPKLSGYIIHPDAKGRHRSPQPLYLLNQSSQHSAKWSFLPGWHHISGGWWWWQHQQPGKSPWGMNELLEANFLSKQG